MLYKHARKFQPCCLFPFQTKYGTTLLYCWFIEKVCASSKNMQRWMRLCFEDILCVSMTMEYWHQYPPTRDLSELPSPIRYKVSIIASSSKYFLAQMLMRPRFLSWIKYLILIKVVVEEWHVKNKWTGRQTRRKAKARYLDSRQPPLSVVASTFYK